MIRNNRAFTKCARRSALLLAIASTCTTWSADWVATGNDMSYTEGRISIGTATAADRLHVAGGGVWIDIHGTSHGSRYYARFLDGGAGKWALANSFYPGLGQSAGALVLCAEEVSGQDLLFSTRNAPDGYVMTMKANGNVGIGTTLPTAKLHVAGAVNISGMLTTGQITTQGQLFCGVTAADIMIGDMAGGDGLRNLVLRAQDQNIATLNASGMTIGSSTIVKNLRVAKVFAGEIEVKSQWWADHVFADGYYLRPLGEVAAHIAEYRHLPDMPSEAEVLEQGINVADMAARQQAKIEELTLYAIAADRENKALQAQIVDLRQNLVELRALVEAQLAAGAK